MSTTIRSNLGFAFAGAFVLLGAIVFMAYRSTQHLIVANQQGQASAQRLLELERTYAILVDAENGQRGYLLTGVDRYLEPYYAALERIPEQRARLDALAIPSPALARIDSLIDRKIADLNASILLYRSRGLDPARTRVADASGTSTMDSLRATLNQLSGNERRSLASTVPEERDHAREVLLTITALSLVGLTVLGSLFLTVLGYTRKRAQVSEPRPWKSSWASDRVPSGPGRQPRSGTGCWSSR
jgi:CHASE3 domain sensor protein